MSNTPNDTFTTQQHINPLKIAEKEMPLPTRAELKEFIRNMYAELRENPEDAAAESWLHTQQTRGWK